jgi:hypothetical protein
MVRAKAPGVYPYALTFADGERRASARGVIADVHWTARFFASEVDPREDLARWRAQSRAEGAVAVELAELALAYGHGGPSERALAPELTQARLPADRFGMVATARVPLAAGRWRLATLSDDGVRVLADGQAVIEDWTWHGPTRHTAELELASARTVELTVEHFELDGYAVLELALEPVR